MSGWGMNPDQLHGSGGQIRDLQPEAHAVVHKLSSSLSEAAGAVKHGRLAAAIETFRDDQNTAGKRFAHNVGAAGSIVQKVAVTGNGTDLDIASGLHAVAGQSMNTTTVLARDINA